MCQLLQDRAKHKVCLLGLQVCLLYLPDSEIRREVLRLFIHKRLRVLFILKQVVWLCIGAVSPFPAFENGSLCDLAW